MDQTHTSTHQRRCVCTVQLHVAASVAAQCTVQQQPAQHPSPPVTPLLRLLSVTLLLLQPALLHLLLLPQPRSLQPPLPLLLQPPAARLTRPRSNKLPEDAAHPHVQEHREPPGVPGAEAVRGLVSIWAQQLHAAALPCPTGSTRLLHQGVNIPPRSSPGQQPHQRPCCTPRPPRPQPACTACGPCC